MGEESELWLPPLLPGLAPPEDLLVEGGRLEVKQQVESKLV